MPHFPTFPAIQAVVFGSSATAKRRRKPQLHREDGEGTVLIAFRKTIAAFCREKSICRTAENRSLNFIRGKWPK